MTDLDLDDGRCCGCGWVVARQDDAIFHVDGAVGEACEVFIVGDDDKGLAKAVAQVEEELMEFVFVFRV